MVSRTVTVKVFATPAVVEAGAETANRAATGGVALLETVPVMPVAGSVAVIVSLPTVMKVTLAVAVPFAIGMSAGSTAEGSELVKWRAPE